MISVIMPCIHMDRIPTFWRSLQQATSREVELVVVGPYESDCDVPHKYIKDWGNPTRCFNIGLQAATGEYVTLASDDMDYYPSAIDRCLDQLEAMGTDKKNVVSAKHFYGGVDIGQTSDRHYKINSYPQHHSRFIPDSYYLMNVCFMHTQYLKELGGLDSIFEHHGVANVDLAVRAQRDGAKVALSFDSVCLVQHTDTTQGDHAPIHYAVTEHDEPLFLELHNTPEGVRRTRIDINNWQQAEARWKRRFGGIHAR